MKHLQIETNLSLEYLYTLTGVAYYESYNSPTEHVATQRFHHYISDFVKNIYPSIPVLVRQDIQLFLKDFSSFYIVILDMILQDNLSHPRDIINYLRTLTTKEMLTQYLDRIDTPLSVGIDSPQLEQYLDELSSMRHENAKDKILFHEFYNYPEHIMERMIYALEFFYDNFFRYEEEETLRILTPIQERHQALYDSNPESFINTILFQSKESLKDMTATIHIFVSRFYGDHISVAYNDNHQVYFFYGISAEKKLYSDDYESLYEELLKYLADETRRNLIRFLMNEAHYNKEISDYLGITTATISYHVSRLVDIGILKLKYQEGKRIYYQVDKERFNQLFDGLKRYMSSDPLDLQGH